MPNIRTIFKNKSENECNNQPTMLSYENCTMQLITEIDSNPPLISSKIQPKRKRADLMKGRVGTLSMMDFWEIKQENCWTKREAKKISLETHEKK